MLFCIFTFGKDTNLDFLNVKSTVEKKVENLNALSESSEQILSVNTLKPTAFKFDPSILCGIITGEYKEMFLSSGNFKKPLNVLHC